MKEQKHTTTSRRGRPAPKKSGKTRSDAAHLSKATRRKIWLASVAIAVVFVFLASTALYLLIPDDIDVSAEPAYVPSGPRSAFPGNGSKEKVVAKELPSIEQVPEAIQSLVESAVASTGEAADSANAEDKYFRITYRSGTIDRSLFDEKQAGVSDPVLLKLSEIFGWDIDFALDMHEGDHYLVLYEDRYKEGRKDTTILAAQFVNRGKVYRAIGFPLEDRKTAYFTPTGRRLQRTFLRTPVQLSNVSSPFSKARYHPILNIWKAHTGVDYAAAPGAPVRATASGRVVLLGWNGGYGRTIVLKHIGTYSTLYAHLSRYRQGLEVGMPVQQGDVIGYVGQSGLATGPHLHYEFRVNGEHRNPLTSQPHQAEGDMISAKLREEFFRVARTRTARLDLLSGRQVASQ